jgi:isochorismate synthase
MTLSNTAVSSRDRARLQAAFLAASRRARALDRPVLTSVLLSSAPIEPLTAYAHSSTLADTRAFWSGPSGDLSLVGLDAAWSCEGRPAQAAVAWRELIDGAVIDALDSPAGAEPLLLAGFAFDPARPPTSVWAGYPAGLAFLPRLLVASCERTTQVRVNAVLEPDAGIEDEIEHALDLFARLQSQTDCQAPAEPPVGVEDLMPAGRWQSIVAGVVEDLDRLGLEKAVLARATRVWGAAPFATAPILRALRAAYPGCFVFAFGRGRSCFLGATPEQLVSLHAARIDAVSLAGTIARGRDAAEDAALAARLLDNVKEQNEHNIVVRAMRESLRLAGAREVSFAGPTVLKLANVQHLQTRLTAQPASGTGVLDLVACLHPTPAVGGYPRDRALRLIREREQLDRGWYAGPVGWVDAAGEGEFAVALRSAVIHDDEALLFAGCGIVPGSDPAAEYAESSLKLRPMLAALGAGARAEKGADL